MHAFVDVPRAQAGAARSFWSAVSGWPTGPEWPGHPEFTSLEPPDGTSYLHVQTIGGPARVHLDLVGDPGRETSRLEALGGTRGQLGDGWQVMASPAGLPFCICGEPEPHRRPGAARWPGGHRSRLVQVCVDVPHDRYEAEIDFWRAATGWADEEVSGPEFHRLVHRSESPLQLLVQRLGRDDEGTHARAHLDLGSNDVEAEVRRLEALGAPVISRDDGFIVLRDPVGLPFCVTSNDPDR
jgi:hypothetical protein